MKIIKSNFNTTAEKTLMYDEIHNLYFVVSSISFETLIFESDETGLVKSYAEVYGEQPADHDGVINKLVKKELTIKNFSLGGK
jgi:hypothetical protein